MAGYNFKKETAKKLLKIANAGTLGNGTTADDIAAPPVAFGKVTVAAAGGSETAPTTGKFNPINVKSASTASVNTSVQIPFANTTSETFSVGDVVTFIDAGFAYHPTASVSSSGATVGYGELASDLDAGDSAASVTLDAGSPLEGGSTVSAKNWVGMEGDTGTNAIVAKSGSEYILIQLACPPEETP